MSSGSGNGVAKGLEVSWLCRRERLQGTQCGGGRENRGEVLSDKGRVDGSLRE